MTACEKYICSYVYDFVEKNWDNIDRKKCDLNETKEQFLKNVKSNFQDAIWVITEVMNWAMDKDYYKELRVFPMPDENTEEKFYVIKLADKYIKYEYLKDFSIKASFSEKKTKTIVINYWE